MSQSGDESPSVARVVAGQDGSVSMARVKWIRATAASQVAKDNVFQVTFHRDRVSDPVAGGMDNADMSERPIISARDQERRLTVERYHQLKDAEEDYELAKAAATSREERQAFGEELHRFRSAHREEETRQGKRSPGIGVTMHQNMWARWLEVASEHEQAAADAYAAILAGERDRLGDELRAGLVAIAASASTIEALYEDTRYLIEPRPPKDTAPKRITDGLAAAFGLGETDRQALLVDLKALFGLRNDGLHGYSETLPPAPHPAGFMTGVESSLFGGPASRVALDTALRALGYAEQPPAPANRWVRRWVEERAAHHRQVVKPIRDALAG